MCVVFADQMAVARASGRRGDVARLWIRTIGGMTSAAWREHRSTRALALGIAARSPRPSRLRVITVVGRDLRFAARSWRKTPGFTVAALGTLALCFGANVTIFAAVNAILLRPLPFPDADRLVAVFNTYPRAGVMDDGASVTNYYERRGRIAAFTGISLYRDDGVIVGGAGATEREFVTRVSPDFFATLGIAPSLGRAFDDAETTPGADHAVILTDGYWRERFGSDRAVVGRTMRVNGSPFTIVGVLPPEFSFLSSTRRLYLPLSSRPQDRGPAGRHSGSSSHMLARLAPGVSIEDAQAQVDADNAARADQYPGAAMIAASGFRSIVVPLHASHVAAIRPALLLLQGGVLCLLLIGLVNVANLLLVRASARDRRTQCAAGRRGRHSRHRRLRRRGDHAPDADRGTARARRRRRGRAIARGARRQPAATGARHRPRRADGRGRNSHRGGRRPPARRASRLVSPSERFERAGTGIPRWNRRAGRTAHPTCIPRSRKSPCRSSCSRARRSSG